MGVTAPKIVAAPDSTATAQCPTSLRREEEGACPAGLTGQRRGKACAGLRKRACGWPAKLGRRLAALGRAMRKGKAGLDWRRGKEALGASRLDRRS